MKKLTIFSRFALLSLIVALLAISPSLLADSGANHRVLNNNYGVSGGNVKDISRRFCCSGTLGSLVQDALGTKYILSNNHVLAISDQASPGDDISQPGLIDNNCAVPRIVADFTGAVTLGNNVDAAIAELRSGTMNTTGAIEDIGTISSVVKLPSVGLSVAKSGRTTGFTTGTISSINTSVSVRYSKSCGSNTGPVFSYTNQVVINSSTFSAGGDSGSLIVSNNACHQPVALLFAGSSTTTIANPITEVLTKLGTATAKTLTFVGGVCTASASGDVSDSGPSIEAVNHATRAMRSRERDIMSRPSVIGVGVGASDDNSNEAVIVVYVDVKSGVRPQLPRRVDGVRVKRVYTEPFVAY
jgi:hypothetical protein